MSKTIDKYLGKKVAEDADKYEYKDFGRDAKVELKESDRGKGYNISIYTDGIVGASSWDDEGRKCLQDAKKTLEVLKRKVSAVANAISWMEQNAKKW